MSSPFPSKQVYINSSHGTYDSNGYHTWVFKDALTIPANYSYLLSLQDFQMPHSFYAISAARGNNRLNLMHRDFGVEEDHTYFDLVLPDGNYSVYEILDKFTELHPNDFTYEYDEVRNKVTISSLSDLELYVMTPLAYALGFRESQLSIPGNSLTGHGIVSLVPIQAIYVRTNMLTMNLDSRTGQMSPIIAKIPILASAMSFISFENPNGHSVRIREKNINIIQVRLEDSDGNLLDRNEQDYQLTLQFDVYKPDRLVRLKSHRYEDVEGDELAEKKEFSNE